MNTKTNRNKGGQARADSLTPEERSRIAQKAAKARWNNTFPQATHESQIEFGSIVLPCSIIEGNNGDVIRVVSARGISTAFTGKIGGGFGAQNLPRFLAAKDVNPFISQDLMARMSSPIEYRPLHGGRSAYGYDATLLPEICETILDARNNGELRSPVVGIVAETIIRGLARVGIIALIDEATGYQASRAKDSLAKILEAFIAKELQPWVATFPTEYYQELFRIRGLPFPSGTVKRPQYFGVLTNNIIYDRLAPGVKDELKKAIPRNKTGRPTAKYFQKLTQNIGYMKLRELLSSVITMMKLSHNWNEFIEKLDKIHPKFGDTLMLPLESEYKKDDDNGYGI